MAGPERAADDDSDLRHDGIGNGIHHFRARLYDAAPLGVAADHESVDVVQKDQRDQVLVAVHDEAGGFFRGFGVNHAAKL